MKRIYTSYLNNRELEPLMDRSDVTIVRICRGIYPGQTRRYNTAIEAFYPSEEARDKAKEDGDLSLYTAQLTAAALDYDRLLNANAFTREAGIIILACQEGPWTRCHRVPLYNAMMHEWGLPLRHDSTVDVLSRYGGLARP